jgi:hypothetical protein
MQGADTIQSAFPQRRRQYPMPSDKVISAPPTSHARALDKVTR